MGYGGVIQLTWLHLLNQLEFAAALRIFDQVKLLLKC